MRNMNIYKNNKYNIFLFFYSYKYLKLIDIIKNK